MGVYIISYVSFSRIRNRYIHVSTFIYAVARKENAHSLNSRFSIYEFWPARSFLVNTRD